MNIISRLSILLLIEAGGRVHVVIDILSLIDYQVHHLSVLRVFDIDIPHVNFSLVKNSIRIDT